MSKYTEQRLQELESEIAELKKNALTAETITNKNGAAIKFADGTMICLQAKSVTTTITTKQTLMYTSQPIALPDFPIAFINMPVVQMSIDDDETNWFCWLRRRCKATKTNPRKMHFD